MLKYETEKKKHELKKKKEGKYIYIDLKNKNVYLFNKKKSFLINEFFLFT